MRDVKVYDRSDLRKYRTETPNTVVKGEISKKLGVHAKFFYIYLKSVAGENGECWQSTKTLSEGTGMAAGTISKCKKELAKIGLIEIDKGDHKKGKSDVITIVDIWGKNMLEYASNQTPSSDEHPPSPRERTPSSDETTCSSDEPKKEPYNQERTLEEERARVFGVPVPDELLEVEDFISRFESYWEYLKNNFRLQPSIPAIEANFRSLIELKKKGNDPLKVIDQTINAGNKSFYPLKEDYGGKDKPDSELTEGEWRRKNGLRAHTKIHYN